MIRDPRDTAVSFYFQATRRSHVYRGDLSEFLRDPRFGMERVILFNLQWLRERHRFSAFSLLSYEELHVDPHGAFTKAMVFLTGRTPSVAEVECAVKSSSFAEMRALEASGGGARQWGVRLSPGDVSDPESFKTRRGIVHGWRDYFTPADEAYATALLEQHDYFSAVAAVAAALPLQRPD